jgi:hypothetical protein
MSAKHPKGYELIDSFVFDPYIQGGGPAFVLIMWDTGRTDEYRKHVLPYRLTMFSNGVPEVLFEGEDYHCAPSHAIDSNEAVATLMSFLTLRPGDTDDEFFANYTPAQLEYCAQYAETLSCEVTATYGEG